MRVNMLAPYISADGYGQAAGNILLELDRLPDVDIFPIHVHPKYTNEKYLHPRILELCRRPVEAAPVILIFCPPMAGIGPKFEGQKVINFTMFETTKIPSFWAGRVNSVDLILNPSQWGVDVFKKCGVTAPMQVQNLGVAKWRNEYLDERKRERTPFVFGWQANNGNDNRKGARILIKAFQECFGDNPNIELWLKSRLNVNFPLPKENNIVFFLGENTDKEMHKFYGRVNCFTYPSKGEGWGLPPLEAMATGCPLIATNWSAMTEFLDEEYCYPLKVKRLVKIDQRYDYPPGYFGDDVGKWAEPDYDHLCELMTYVYENYKEALEKGRLAYKAVKKNWTFDIIAKQIREKVQKMID